MPPKKVKKDDSTKDTKKTGTKKKPETTQPESPATSSETSVTPAKTTTTAPTTDKAPEQAQKKQKKEETKEQKVLVLDEKIPSSSQALSYSEFDPEAYIKPYSGPTVVVRLRWIAEKLPEKRVQCYRLAIDHLKQTLDTQTYQEVVSKAREVCGDELGDGYFLDQTWIGSQNRAGIDKQTRLESQLALTKRDEETDPIRKCIEAIAEHHWDRGDYSTALAKYLEAKTTGFTNNIQKLENALDIIKAAIFANSYSQVKKQYDQVRRIIKELKDVPLILEARFNAAHGLFHLREGAYSNAAKAFMAVTADLKDNYKEVVSANDVTHYACLCALATFSRRELYQVLENESFRRSEERFSRNAETDLVCRLLLEKKKNI
eukprot:TRINITY_DN3927_c0_g1_i9.p1 TRINITY_DN3927_c0_g1~~TRINITY_DN3927_c0_g1_i9.p1  ORF type:complete len:375 (+),score=80.51 TRINITY_DN3927_c0_g1_i9:172-1296(+)